MPIKTVVRPADATVAFGTGIERLRARQPSAVLLPDPAGYDNARNTWNDLVDRRPVCLV
jgi:hypothetical protein